MQDQYKLKLELMYNGINIEEKYLQMLNTKNYLNKEYITTSGLILNYKDTYVNTPINPQSKYQLIYDDSWKIIVKSKTIVSDINLLLPPKYALNKEKLEDGSLITEYVNTHADRIRIQPIGGCANNCKFCTCNNIPYIKHDMNQLDKCFNIARKEGKGIVRHAFISGGSPKDKEEDYEYMTKVYTHFAQKYTDIEFDIMMAPRGFKSSKDAKNYKTYIDYLNEIGIYGLSINIELYNKELRKRYIPRKYDIGLENYITFLQTAVDVLGTHRVRSCIIVGLEPIEDTIKGIELLCQIGCMPVLSLYVPINGIHVKKPSVETMLKVREEAEEISNKYDVPLGPICKPCTHNLI